MTFLPIFLEILFDAEKKYAFFVVYFGNFHEKKPFSIKNPNEPFFIKPYTTEGPIEGFL